MLGGGGPQQQQHFLLEAPSAPRPCYYNRSCVEFEEGYLLKDDAPMLPMLLDEDSEDEVCDNRRPPVVMLRPRPTTHDESFSSTSIFRSNNDFEMGDYCPSSPGISSAKSICSSMDEEEQHHHHNCPSLPSLDDSSSYSDESSQSSSFYCGYERKQQQGNGAAALTLVYLHKPAEEGREPMEEENVFNLRPRTTTQEEFDDYLSSNKFY